MAMRFPGFMTRASEDLSSCALSSASGAASDGQGKFQRHSAISGSWIALRNDKFFRIIRDDYVLLTVTPLYKK
jgi:hypothetical protein